VASWRDERRGAENLAYELPEGHMLRGNPCVVAHEDAGGECARPGTMMVCGLLFCEVHGEEAKAGALEELYHDATQDLTRPLNPHVKQLNPEAVRVLERYEAFSLKAGDEKDVEEMPLRAFPLIRERASGMTLDYLAAGREHQRAYNPPYDEYRAERLLIHGLMRRAFEEVADWLVEVLERHREHAAAQAAFALALERAAGLRFPLA
jgi:hypothetical protein